ncbi:hypothetical protein B0H21DRAFT_857046 [Amylocystis lapponica]|nr:hypothetical protein B0H21DRAFT_857046 [Amylocystis lapponica]
MATLLTLLEAATILDGLQHTLFLAVLSHPAPPQTDDDLVTFCTFLLAPATDSIARERATSYLLVRPDMRLLPYDGMHPRGAVPRAWVLCTDADAPRVVGRMRLGRVGAAHRRALGRFLVAPDLRAAVAAALRGTGRGHGAGLARIVRALVRLGLLQVDARLDVERLVPALAGFVEDLKDGEVYGPFAADVRVPPTIQGPMRTRCSRRH